MKKQVIFIFNKILSGACSCGESLVQPLDRRHAGLSAGNAGKEGQLVRSKPQKCTCWTKPLDDQL